MKQSYSSTIEENLKNFNSSIEGINSLEAKTRLEKNGQNTLGEAKKKSWILKFLAQFKDVMIIILLLAAAVSIGIAIVEKSTSELVDGIIILAIVLLNAIIGFVQEHKAETAMEALKKMTKPEAKVLRDGELLKLPSSELVVGDVVVLEAGDIVPADVRLLETALLKCDESSLTGESKAVNKEANLVLKDSTPLGDRNNMAFSGSTVVNGRALALVVATGRDTEIGKIAKMLEESKKEDTPLQKSIKQVGKVITIIVLVVAVITFIVEMIARPNEPLEAFLTAVAIAVAAIPESLPAVITIIMSLGVARLAKRRAIVKRLHAVETLGSCEVICSDKTGTLTQNIMTVTALYYDGNQELSPEPSDRIEYKLCNEIMTLCNDSKKNKNKFVGDPTETALCDYALKNGFNKTKEEKLFPRVFEIPFDSVRKMQTTVHKKESDLYQYTKGAPEMLLNRCTQIMVGGKVCELTTERKNQILSANRKMGGNALRVLALAYKKLRSSNPKTATEEDLIFVGLVGMIDPPRPEVKDAVQKCLKAGIRPIMITGDHKHTAFAIAKEIGIAKKESEVLTGAEIDSLNDEEFLKVLPKINVFARVSPENKVRIVNGLKSQGKIVAMTGDGVNDAPSIKSANIGVGMGITGTDVTKEVADIIVTDDNFATIVVAVEEGRKIYANITKTIQFLFSANLAEIISIFVATIAFPSFIFLSPVQILFVNLITDSFPAIALGLEPAEADIMKEKPRKNGTSVFGGGMGYMMAASGIIQAELILIGYTLGILFFTADVAMSMAFYSLNLVQFFYFVSMRVKRTAFKSSIFKNKWAVIAIVFALSILAIIAFTPLHTFIGLTSLNLTQWLIVIGLSALIFPLNEIFKIIRNRSFK